MLSVSPPCSQVELALLTLNVRARCNYQGLATLLPSWPGSACKIKGSVHTGDSVSPPCSQVGLALLALIVCMRYAVIGVWPPCSQVGPALLAIVKSSVHTTDSVNPPCSQVELALGFSMHTALQSCKQSQTNLGAGWPDFDNCIAHANLVQAEPSQPGSRVG